MIIFCPLPPFRTIWRNIFAILIIPIKFFVIQIHGWALNIERNVPDSDNKTISCFLLEAEVSY